MINDHLTSVGQRVQLALCPTTGNSGRLEVIQKRFEIGACGEHNRIDKAGQ
jgi:hypothetical protein